MKNLFLILCVACLLAACSKDDQIFNLDTDTYEDYKDNNTIDELKDYNRKTLSQFTLTRSSGRYGKIARRDVIGAMKGLGCSGWTHNPYVIGFVTALYAAMDSYEAYEENNGNCITTNEIMSLYNTHQTLCRQYATAGNEPELMDSTLFVAIGLPLEYRHLAVLGEYHNGVLRRFLHSGNNVNDHNDDNGECNSDNEEDNDDSEETDSGDNDISGINSLANLPTTLSATNPEDIFDTESLPTLFDCPVEMIDSLFNDADFRSSCTNKVLNEPDLSTMDAVEDYIDSIEGISDDAKEACCMYIDLFDNCPDNIQTILQIARGYINIVESNNDLTPEEKSVLYSGIIVSLYSTALWNNEN